MAKHCRFNFAALFLLYIITCLLSGSITVCCQGHRALRVRCFVGGRAHMDVGGYTVIMFYACGFFQLCVWWHVFGKGRTMKPLSGKEAVTVHVQQTQHPTQSH